MLYDTVINYNKMMYTIIITFEKEQNYNYNLYIV